MFGKKACYDLIYPDDDDKWSDVFSPVKWWPWPRPWGPAAWARRPRRRGGSTMRSKGSSGGTRRTPDGNSNSSCSVKKRGNLFGKVFWCEQLDPNVCMCVIVVLKTVWWCCWVSSWIQNHIYWQDGDLDCNAMQDTGVDFVHISHQPWGTGPTQAQ